VAHIIDGKDRGLQAGFENPVVAAPALSLR